MLPDLQSINPLNLPLLRKQQLFKEFFILFILFFTIDYFFIKYVSGPIFQVNIKNIQGSPMNIRYLPAAFAWLASVLTLYYFIILDNKSPIEAAFLGFLVYSVYDGTNAATFKKWSIKAFTVDILWGTTIFFITTLIFNYIKPFIQP